MTDFEDQALAALAGVSMRLGSGGKRFRNDMLWHREHEPGFKLTARQASYLWFLVDMYRRQITSEDLKAFGVHRRLTGELPEIYIEGDHRLPIIKVKSAKHKKKFPEKIVQQRDDERTLFGAEFPGNVTAER
jgi:hypothetical protein